MSPSQHKTPLLGWHPSSAEDEAWLRARAERLGVPLARLLDVMLADYRAANAEALDARDRPSFGVVYDERGEFVLDLGKEETR